MVQTFSVVAMAVVTVAKAGYEYTKGASGQYSNTKYLANFQHDMTLDECKYKCSHWEQVCNDVCKDDKKCALSDDVDARHYSRDESCQKTCHGFNLREGGHCTLFDDTVDLRNGGRGTWYGKHFVADHITDGPDVVWDMHHQSHCDGHQTMFENCDTYQPCNEGNPVDCGWGEWSAFSDCDCTGLQQRHRSISRSNNPQGQPCAGPTVETGQCESKTCPWSKHYPECNFHQWSHWSDCHEVDAKHQKYRTRTVSEPEHDRYEGHGCRGALKETVDCPVDIVDGKWSAWTSWCECSVPCGGGQSSRNRHIATQPKNGGDGVTGAMSETQACNPQSCNTQINIDCVWGNWHRWSACTCSCGGGQKTRDRSIVTAPRGDGALCAPESMAQIAECNGHSCDDNACVDGKWGEWNGWGPCSASCGGGLSWKTRVVTQEANECGRVPEGVNKQFESCNLHSCSKDVDCQFSDWGKWGDCSCCCGGVARRYRTIARYGSGKGAWCEGTLTDIQGCSGRYEDCKQEQPHGKCPAWKHTIPSVDCQLGSWQEWGGCSVSCGSQPGQSVHKREILQEAKNGGKPCEGPLTKFGHCYPHQECPEARACEWTAWSAWSACDKCGGQQRRSREIKHMPQEGWKPCESGAAEETKKCPRQCHASTFCVWSMWSDESDCSATCGDGFLVRKRVLESNVTHRRLSNGQYEVPTEVASENECSGRERNRISCRKQDCDSSCRPQNCTLGEWADWGHVDTGSCTGLCSRKRPVKNPNNECGAPCKGCLVETKKGCMEMCEHAHPPPSKNCEFGQWSHWSSHPAYGDCTEKTRNREIIQHSSHGGEPCKGRLEEVDDCTYHDKHCHLSQWTHWGDCSTDCGQGQRQRHREVQQGQGCNADLCQTEPCTGPGTDCGTDVDCLWGAWNRWSACTCKCGGGQRYRSRVIETAPKGGGAHCEPKDATEAGSCNTQQCPHLCIDGKFSEWGGWGECNAPCGGGLRWRRRKIATEANACGQPAEGVDLEVHECNTHSCQPDIDCQLAAWTHWSACSCTRNGEQQRSRTIGRFGKGDGRFCHGALKEVKNCNEYAGPTPTPAPETCHFSNWHQTECSVSCGGGTRTCHRTSTGHCEGILERVETCNTEACPVCKDCIKVCNWGEWEHWDSCTKCGGQRKRTRQMHSHAWAFGAKHGRRLESEIPTTSDPCKPGASEETSQCPRKCGDAFICEWSAWDRVGSCSATCGTGTQKKVRTLVARLATDADLQGLQNNALVQEIGLKNTPETTVFLSFCCGVISFALFAGIWQRCTKSSQYDRTPLPMQRGDQLLE